MQIEDLELLIKDYDELKQHESFIKSLTKPCVDISILEKAGGDSESRFGGMPLVPQSFEWPKNKLGNYKFLGQINFSEIASGPSDLPQTGLLSLFFVESGDEELVGREDGFIASYYWPELSEMKLYKPRNTYKDNSRKIELNGGVDIPRHAELRKNWPFNENILFEIAENPRLSQDYLLGYPSYYTLGYDPTPGSGWVSFLNVQAHEQFDWYWNDGLKLMVFIENEKMKKSDFSNLKADTG